jgi:hypothetical protein
MDEQNGLFNNRTSNCLGSQREFNRLNGPHCQPQGQRSHPLQRKTLKRVRVRTTPRPVGAVFPLQRRLITDQQPTTHSKLTSTDRSQGTVTARTERTTVNTCTRPVGFVDSIAERETPEQQLTKKQQDKTKRRRLEKETKNSLTADRKESRKADAERRRQQQEIARRRAEVELRYRQKALEQRRSAAEQKRKEIGAEQKRQKEERIRKTKKAEQKYTEVSKTQHESERQRIFQTIESCRGKLNERQAELARQIAAEMVIRNIKWHGHISLSSGIGGAMRR